MKEKIKNWNWRLIGAIFLLVIYFGCYLFFTIGLGGSEFDAMKVPEYEPTVDCFYGIALTLVMVFFICSIVQFWKVLDIVIPPKKKEGK